MSTPVDRRAFIREYLNGFQLCLASLDAAEVERLLEILEQAYCEDRTVFVLGNGGSAATAAHMACDLTKNAIPDRPGLRVLALPEQVPYLTALANDTGYERVFAEMLRLWARPGDVVIVISGSGNSPNVLEAIRTARQIGATVVGLLGFDGGQARTLVDHCVHVRADHYGYVEDAHMVLNHLITSYFQKRYGPAPYPGGRSG
nr:MAG: phosphoheptose isomerase [Bacteroidota bacterium]